MRQEAKLADTKIPEKRIDRLVKKVIADRKAYQESIKGKTVWVRPNFPRSGVVGFHILTTPEDEKKRTDALKRIERRERDAGRQK